MNDLASTINGGAIAMPDPEQMDRRLILKRAHQNSSGSSGSEPDSKNLRKRLNVGESGDSMRSMTSGTTTENDVFHKYVGQPQSGGGHVYDVMDDLAQRIEPVHRPIEVFEKLDDSLFDGAGPFGDFEGTDEDDGFLHDDGLMMWDDGDDLGVVPPGDADAAAAAAAARVEVTQLVAGLDDGRKEALKSLLARSGAHGAAPDALQRDVRSILSASHRDATDAFPGGHFDDPAHAFDPSTLQYLREAMLSDGGDGGDSSGGGGGGGGLEPLTISGKSDRSDAPTKRSNGRARANRTPTTEDSSTPTSQSSAASSSRRKTAAQKRKEEQEKEKAAAGLLRGNYRCGRCGLPKVNHVCQFVDAAGSHVAVQVDAPILDVATGLPFEGERFLSISAANSPAPSRSSHKSMAMAVVSPRSATLAAVSAYDSMDVDDASSTVSFGAPAGASAAAVGSPFWAQPPLQGQLAMSLDGYEYAALAPAAVQNPLLMGQFYHPPPPPPPPPDPSSFGAGPFYPPPPQDDDAAYEQSAYDAFHPDRQQYQQQQQQQQNADGSQQQQQQQQQSTRGNGYGFVCTVNDQTDFACFPFFCF